MKLLITSPDAIYDWQNETYFEGVVETLEYFNSLSGEHSVVVVSLHKEKFSIVPESLHTLDLSNNKRLRKSPELINHISSIAKIEYEDIIVLGAKNDDMILAANAKILLLTAVYAENNNPEDRIYTDKYGIAIYNSTRLKYFFDHYLDIDEPWFFSHEISSNTKIFGLTNAMTRGMSGSDEVEICNHLRHHLKDGHDKGQNPFRIYSLLSAYRIFKEIEDVNYWGYYPSSDGKLNEPLMAIKEILRKSFKSRATKDILIRHISSPKRSNRGSSRRASEGCDNQFDSIHLNPYYKGKIKDKCICIIDDFSTHGTSCETARHLLLEAGAKKVIFIALGKFKVTYKIYDYTLNGDIYSPNYTYTRKGSYNEQTGTINNQSSEELLNSLKDSFYD